MEALSMTINHMLEDVFLTIDDNTRPFESMLKDVFYYLLDGSRKFPGISRAHLYRAVVERDRDSASARAMRKLYDRLSQRTLREHPRDDQAELQFATAESLSSILLTMLSPDFFPLPREYRFTSTKNARLLAEAHTRLFVASLRSARPAA
jgi:hypothetical protein